MDRMDMDQLKPPSALGAYVSPRLEQVIMKGLSYRMNLRQQSMIDLKVISGSAPSDGIMQDQTIVSRQDTASRQGIASRRDTASRQGIASRRDMASRQGTVNRQDTSSLFRIRQRLLSRRMQAIIRENLQS